MGKNIIREVLSGITVAIVALPLAIAFGIAATGGSAEGALVGLYGAIFTGFFAAIFGGTPAQVTGPTGPITVIATGTIATYGLETSFFIFMLAGLFQILLGVFKIGDYIRYIPYSVISGFMNGIALIIIGGQLIYLENSFLVVIATMAIMLLSKRLIKVIPASLVALLAGTALVIALQPYLENIQFSLPAIGTVFLNRTVDMIGTIPQAIPTLHLPQIDFALLPELIPPALSIAILGAIDSLLTSVVMDNVTGIRHKSNKELIGQGIGNMISGLFGGIAGAGATVRSVVNAKSGGRTPISACVHSIVLLILVVGLGDAVQFIPLAVLAGILINTGISMFDWDGFKKIPVTPKADVLIMVLTMVITVAVDLMVAVGIGILLATLIFAKQYGDRGVKLEQKASAYADTFSIQGPLYFASLDHLLQKIEHDSKHDLIILDLNGVNYVDASAAVNIQQFIELMEKKGKMVQLTNLQPSIEKIVASMMGKEAFNKVLVKELKQMDQPSLGAMEQAVIRD